MPTVRLTQPLLGLGPLWEILDPPLDCTISVLHLDLLFTDMDCKRYVDKAPIHQLYLDVLVDKFPDATLIHTYRPLTEVLPSILSLLKHGIDSMGFDTNSPTG